MRILFITSTRIGDAVLSSGLIAHLAEIHPEARFTIACGPLAADLFRDLPNLESLIVMDKGRFGGHWLRLWRETVGTSWDLIVDLRSSAIAWLLRTEKRHVAKKAAGHKVVAASQVLGLAKPAPPKIFVSPDTRARVFRTFGEENVLAIGPSANWIGKQWPVKRFAELATRLTGQGAPLQGAKILVLGASGDREKIEPLLAALPKEQTIDHVGKLDLLSVCVCLEKAALYVGNDSGLMHMAAAAGVPTLGLFGPSNEVLYGPWGDNAAFVRGRQSFDDMTRDNFDFAGAECHMVGLTVDKVEEAARRLLHRHPSSDEKTRSAKP